MQLLYMSKDLALIRLVSYTLGQELLPGPPAHSSLGGQVGAFSDCMRSFAWHGE